MSDLNKLFVGQKLKKIPGKTINTLIAGELRDRALAAAPKNLGASADKSTVIVRLAWDGEESLDPGHVVKLGDVLIDPGDDESAPFAGLQFKCSAFEEGDKTDKYAITLGPIEAAIYDESDPPELIARSIGYGVMINAWWAKVDVTDEEDTNCKPGAPGTLLESGSGGNKILWKPTGTGEMWAVVSFGGGSTGNLTAFAVVTEEAGADGGSIGKCILLDDDMAPSVDLEDAEAVEEAAIEFKSAHNVKCREDARIWLSSLDTIEPGSLWEDHKIWGVLVNVQDYLEVWPAFANSTYLGATGGSMQWREFDTASPDVTATGGGECVEGGIAITIDVDVTGTFIVPPTDP